MVEYIDKKCSRCRMKNGSVKKDGSIISFDMGFKQCDKCMERSRESWESRMFSARKHFPTPFNIGVYAIKEGSEIVYIGSSNILPFRLYKHFQLNNTFEDGLNKLQRKSRYSWHIIWNGDTLEDARWNEKELIKTYKPKYNKTYNNE